MRLRPLTAEDQDAVRDFETVNREFFAASIADRGDAFFADYPARHAALLAMQAAGTDLFHLLVDDVDTIIGRVNLIDIADGSAELGYRIGQRYTGQGHATHGVRLACERARTHGLVRLRAATAVDNHASRAVLLRNGFMHTATTAVDGRSNDLFELPLG